MWHVFMKDSPASMRLNPGAAGMIVSFGAGSKAAKESAAQKERGKGKELLRERSPERNTSLAARKNVSHERRLKKRANLRPLCSVSDSSSQMRSLAYVADGAAEFQFCY
jgi:hypothetical protein